MFFDLPLEKLQTYLPARNEPPDVKAFWQRTLNEARRFPLNAQFEATDTGLQLVETFDVTFKGYNGQAIKDWLILPRPRLPCIVEYIGYGGGRGLPIDWLLWSNAGYAHFVMDEVCPPSTVFAAYNHYAGPKQIKVWPYNHHEGGESFQSVEKMKFLQKLF